MKQAILILMYLVVATYAQSCSYSKLCSDHTMCKYQGYGRNCGKPIYSGVNSNADKQTIVNEHNNLRRQIAHGRETRGSAGVQPSAANMRKMSWDDELARVAQRWADQCNFGHDACRKVGRFGVGQNVYQIMGVSANGQQDWRAAIQAWYNEVKDFSRNDISPFRFSFPTGHYTQVVWADTNKVGCGFTGYKASNGQYHKLYVCNYGPAGNIIGTSMYQVGPACSKCPRSCDNGLCV